MHLEGILSLSRYGLPASRSWTFPSREPGQQKQELKLIPKHTHTQGEDDKTGDPFPTFSAEEVGKVAVMIVQGVERSKAIRAMPRYTRKQHKVFGAFYDQLRESMMEEQKNG
jgi:hypothetical protein